MKPKRFPRHAYQVVRNAIKRTGTTDTWTICQELIKVARRSDRSHPERHMEMSWEIYNISDIIEMIKEVSKEVSA